MEYNAPPANVGEGASIIANNNGFAVLKANGSVVTFGHVNTTIPSGYIAGQLTGGVVKIVPNSSAWACLKDNKTVVAWGPATSDVNTFGTDVIGLYSGQYGVIAVNGDNSVTAFGYADMGGDLTKPNSSTAANLVAGADTILDIAVASRAFAALKSNGTVYAWGDARWGGNWGADTSSVASELTDVKLISGNIKNFCAVKNDGTIVTWGGGGEYVGMTGWISPPNTAGEDIVKIVPSKEAFSLLTATGKVYSFGTSSAGGDQTVTQLPPAGFLDSGVVELYACHFGFLAIKENGTSATWGPAGIGAVNATDDENRPAIKHVANWRDLQL